MEVRCAGNSPKDNSDCMKGAVSISYLLFSVRLPPLGEHAVCEKKKEEDIYIHIYIYSIFYFIFFSPTAFSPKGGSLKE